MRDNRAYKFWSVTPILSLLALLFLNLPAQAEINAVVEELNQLQKSWHQCKRDKKGLIAKIALEGNQSQTVELPAEVDCISQELKFHEQFIKALEGPMGKIILNDAVTHYLDILLKRDVTQIGEINLIELKIEINSLKGKWIKGYSALKPNQHNTRGSGVCLPNEGGFLVSAYTFNQLNYDLKKISGLILHELLCSIPLNNKKPFWSWGQSQIQRKYDDSNYQYSSLIITYANLIEEQDESKIKLFESLWLPSPKDIKMLLLAEGGSLSGGPGGGDSHALWLKVALLEDLFQQQWLCQLKVDKNKDQNKESEVLWGKYSTPCSWLMSSWLQKAFLQMKVEEKNLDGDYGLIASLANNEIFNQALSIYVSFPLNNSNLDIINRDILIEAGYLYFAANMYESKDARDQIINQIFAPCFRPKDYDAALVQTSTCFFH